MKPVETTRDRFLTAVAAKVDAAAIAEVHLFQPIKQGGLESGVAVVAVKEPRAGQTGADLSLSEAKEGAAVNETAAPSAAAENRLAVYTAQYRLTLKGPDRGKWEFSMQADADAPLVTVDAVVRGVQRRVADAVEPVRLTGEDVRAALPSV
jgi:hypothetical protein